MALYTFVPLQHFDQSLAHFLNFINLSAPRMPKLALTAKNNRY